MFDQLDCNLQLPTVARVIIYIVEVHEAWTTYTFQDWVLAVGNSVISTPKSTRNFGRKYPQKAANTRNEAQIQKVLFLGPMLHHKRGTFLNLRPYLGLMHTLILD